MRQLLRTLSHFFWGTPQANARMEIQKAIGELSRRAAEAEFHRLLADFHTNEALALDPHQSWWEFAEHKQKAHENQQDWAVEDRRRKEAEAKLVSCRARFDKLKVPPCETMN